MKNSKNFILLIVSASFLLPIIANADVIPPPTFGFTFIAYLIVFVANLILNFIIFGLAYLIFIKKDNYALGLKKFFIGLIIITIGGFLADTIILIGSYYLQLSELNLGAYRATLWHFILIFAIIFIWNLLICKTYLKINLKKSVFIGLWMGLLTNPIIFYLIKFLFYYDLFEIFRNVLYFGD